MFGTLRECYLFTTVASVIDFNNSISLSQKYSICVTPSKSRSSSLGTKQRSPTHHIWLPIVKRRGGGIQAERRKEHEEPGWSDGREKAKTSSATVAVGELKVVCATCQLIKRSLDRFRFPKHVYRIMHYLSLTYDADVKTNKHSTETTLETIFALYEYREEEERNNS